ncbi:acyltransferase family protein [Chryseobacterium oryctis]|uniref:Acyltransferase n=1 Tax=Chryseobacterium oryctis TaxID=2952618 RepID=A0ABT3HN51_9FLAO|nr:acyltransferase [Chryseobacterium oryctis]MCW3161205.1 acyltransferase [Chryseobacterium oryctis]
MRSLSVDILKIVLAFFVVFLHMHVLRDSYPFLSYVLVNGLFRIGVPVFLIISGYYFYYINDFQKLKKWLVRIFILYAVWSVVYIPFWKEKDDYTLNILFGYHHLWYLIGTFFSGIILFALKKTSTRLLLLFILLLFCCGYIIQFLANSHYFTGDLDSALNLFPTYRNFLFVCFPFLGIGFLIRKLELDVKYKPSLLFVLASVGLVIFEAFLNYKVFDLNKRESVDLLFSLLIACPILFVYCKNLPWKTDSKILASISTAIYLIHPLLMEGIYKSEIKYQNLAFTMALIGASLMLVFINKKLKYLL